MGNVQGSIATHIALKMAINAQQISRKHREKFKRTKGMRERKDWSSRLFSVERFSLLVINNRLYTHTHTFLRPIDSPLYIWDVKGRCRRRAEFDPPHTHGETLRIQWDSPHIQWDSPYTVILPIYSDTLRMYSDFCVWMGQKDLID